MNRREFVRAGAQATSTLLLLRARTVFGYEANSAIRHGLLGCGNRGTTVATSFAKNTTAQVVALADLFPDSSQLLTAISTKSTRRWDVLQLTVRISSGDRRRLRNSRTRHLSISFRSRHRHSSMCSILRP